MEEFLKIKDDCDSLQLMLQWPQRMIGDEESGSQSWRDQ
jgi:hypothetical protein